MVRYWAKITLSFLLCTSQNNLIVTAGNSTTQLSGLRGIALDLTTNILYVSDSNDHHVTQYTLNSTVGTLIAGGNGAGTGRTQLNNPRGLYFESSANSLLIANSGANNIVRWVIGDSNWH